MKSEDASKPRSKKESSQKEEEKNDGGNTPTVKE